MNFKHRAQIYPKNAPFKLGFETIKEQIQTFCRSELGKEELSKISVLADREAIALLLNQTKEFKKLITDKDLLEPDTSYPEIKETLERIRVENTYLDFEEFIRYRTFLRQWAYAVKLFQRNGDELFPDLNMLVSLYPYEKAILASIEAILNEKGDIRPEISPELTRIRGEIKKTETIQDKKFDALLRHCLQNNWLTAEEQSIRNGRRVLAMFSEFKRQIKGIIHDESSTGKTTFIEPQSLVELGNDLFELRQEEKKEIIRVLRELTNELRPYIEHIGQYQKLAGKLDFIAAKAQYAISIGGEFPLMDKKTQLILNDAKHPLLLAAFKDQKRKVVPLNVELDKHQRFLMVSGPNAGGKSICLKTVGLLQIMFQAGIMVPTEAHSKMSVFEKIFLDMGDDQSIENDLSTYSSHLKSLKHFVNFSNSKTLVLLDEFGTGTDPQFGGAMAEAVMDHLMQKGAFGLATTHYSNLKLYAQRTSSMANASMLFDQEKMLPTFKLQIGRPGSSYAFEIAQRIGLNKSVIEYAKNIVGSKAGNYEQLVLQLEREKIELEQKLSSAQNKEQRYKELSEQYKALKDELKQNKKKMELSFKTQLQNELKNQNKKFEQQLAALKSNKKSQEEIAKEIRANLQKKAGKVESEVERLEEQVLQSKSDHDKIKLGSFVKMIDGTETGIVEEISGNLAIVAFNHLRTRVPLVQLQLSEQQKPLKRSSGVSVRNYIMEFNNTVDVRGMRAEDALHELEDLIDNAVVLNHQRVKIIHGRGNGILKKFIAEFLRSNGNVKSFEYEHADHGGDGATLIELQ
ncbi:MAG: endonuclease MutS2 [Bacteroidetes bacterium]|nr:endonuclease MutS2 [Bacteroidota bacterium]